MRKRRVSRAISIGGVTIGGGAPVVVQSMTKTDTRNVAATAQYIHREFGDFVGYWNADLALATFVAPGPLLWAYVILGGAASVVAMSATVHVARTWDVPALTFPFVLVTWLLLLATYGFAGLSGTALPAAGVVAPFETVAATRLDAGLFVQATLLSISQVFLKGSGIAALLFLAGLAVNSRAAAIAALAGAIVAVVTAHLLGAESDLVTGGLMGFSPVLTAVALGAVFYKPGVRVAVYALVATVFTVVVQGALNVVVAPFGIPTLTAPFVLASWFFLLRHCALRFLRLTPPRPWWPRRNWRSLSMGSTGPSSATGTTSPARPRTPLEARSS